VPVEKRAGRQNRRVGALPGRRRYQGCLDGASSFAKGDCEIGAIAVSRLVEIVSQLAPLSRRTECCPQVYRAQIGKDGALLVRPDGFIAWRACCATPESGQRLREVLEKILGPSQRNIRTS
jgi:hypothetical protein